MESPRALTVVCEPQIPWFMSRICGTACTVFPKICSEKSTGNGEKFAGGTGDRGPNLCSSGVVRRRFVGDEGLMVR